MYCSMVKSQENNLSYSCKFSHTWVNVKQGNQNQKPKCKWAYFPFLLELQDSYASPQLHTDAFFLSLRDINRHRSWLDFWKIQVNLVNFLSCTFGTDWDKNSKSGLTFGHLAFLCLRFFLKKLFFSMRKQNFGNVIQIYVQI